MRSRRRQLPLCVLTLAVLAMSGCEQPKNVAGKPPAPAPAAEGHLHRRQAHPGHRQVRPQRGDQKGGAPSPTSRSRARDPITLSGNAYVTSIGKISVDQMDYAVKLFQAENDRFPKDYQEFMDEIIKKNNIALPKLPFYQEYKYDEVNHKLLVIEYPEKKAGPLPQ